MIVSRKIFIILALVISMISFSCTLKNQVVKEKDYYVHMWAKRDTECRLVNDVVFYNSLECLGKQTRILMNTPTIITKNRPEWAPASLRVNTVIHTKWGWQWDLGVPQNWNGVSNCIEDIWVAPDVSDKVLGHEIYHLIKCSFHQ